MFFTRPASHFDEDALQVSGSRLTERERQCLAYTAQGLSAKEISRIIDQLRCRPWSCISIRLSVSSAHAIVRKLWCVRFTTG